MVVGIFLFLQKPDQILKKSNLFHGEFNDEDINKKN